MKKEWVFLAKISEDTISRTMSTFVLTVILFWVNLSLCILSKSYAPFSKIYEIKTVEVKEIQHP